MLLACYFAEICNSILTFYILYLQCSCNALETIAYADFLVQYNSTQFFLEHMQCFAHETFKAIQFCFAYNAVICQKNATVATVLNAGETGTS